jgi:hypothetical protein
VNKRKTEIHSKTLKNYQDKLGEPFSNHLDFHLLGVADPSFGAASAIDTIAHIGVNEDSTTTTQLTQDAIEAQTKAFLDDDVTAAAELLYGQVLTLNAAFNKLMQLSVLTMKGERFEVMFDAALKAQEQARRTLQTIAEIKNPKPKAMIIRNAIAQQVNQLTVKTSELEKRLEGGYRKPVQIPSKIVDNELLEIDCNPCQDGQKRHEKNTAN